MNLGKREDILGRIREALRVPAPRPHDGHDGVSVPADQVQQSRAWLPAVPADAEGQLALFQKNCVQLRTDLQLVTGVEEAAKMLASLRKRTDGSLRPRTITLCWTQSWSHWSWKHCFRSNVRTQMSLERCSVGITACDA